MCRFKYITEKILDDVLFYIQEKLNERRMFMLLDDEVLYLKRTILDKCFIYLSNEFIPDNSFEGFRVIVEYDGGVAKAFYPQLIINKSEREYAFNNYLVNQFLGYECVIKDEEEIFKRLLEGLCRLLAISLYCNREHIEQLAKRMINYGKKVVEIRKGKLNSNHGKYFGNPFKGKRHVDWFPYVEIDEWSIFSEVVRRY